MAVEPDGAPLRAGLLRALRLCGPRLLGYYLDFSRVFMDAWFLLVFGLAAGGGAVSRALLALSGLGAAAFVAAYAAGMI